MQEVQKFKKYVHFIYLLFFLALDIKQHLDSLVLSGISSVPELGSLGGHSSTFSCRNLPSERQNELPIPLQWCNGAGTVWSQGKASGWNSVFSCFVIKYAQCHLFPSMMVLLKIGTQSDRKRPHQAWPWMYPISTWNRKQNSVIRLVLLSPIYVMIDLF